MARVAASRWSRTLVAWVISVGVASALAAALPSAAQADPPPWAGGPHHHDDGEDYHVVYVPAPPVVYPYYVFGYPVPVASQAADDDPIALLPENSQNYRVMPARNDGENGRYCREYQATASVNGRSQAVWGTACRRPDGQWEIVD